MYGAALFTKAQEDNNVFGPVRTPFTRQSLDIFACLCCRLAQSVQYDADAARSLSLHYSWICPQNPRRILAGDGTSTFHCIGRWGCSGGGREARGRGCLCRRASARAGRQGQGQGGRARRARGAPSKVQLHSPHRRCRSRPVSKDALCRGSKACRRDSPLATDVRMMSSAELRTRLLLFCCCRRMRTTGRTLKEATMTTTTLRKRMGTTCGALRSLAARPTSPSRTLLLGSRPCALPCTHRVLCSS